MTDTDEHPLIDKTLEALEMQDDKLILSDENRGLLQGVLVEVEGGELVAVTLRLVELAWFLRNEKSAPEAADSILQLAMTTQDKLRALGSQGANAAEALAGAQKDLGRVTGAAESKFEGAKPPAEGQQKASPLARFNLDVPKKK